MNADEARDVEVVSTVDAHLEHIFAAIEQAARRGDKHLDHPLNRSPLPMFPEELAAIVGKLRAKGFRVFERDDYKEGWPLGVKWWRVEW